MQPKNLAAIDLGSNSCRLQIRDINGTLLYRESQTTKLAEGLMQQGYFTDQALQRGLSCLTHYADLMKLYNVVKYRAIATASCRIAKNSRQFVQMVEEICGIKLEIIDAYEEAKLNLCGAMLNADKNKKYVLVYDLGGASTEITLASNQPNPYILYTISIPWGARNASEVYDLLEYDEIKAEKLCKEIQKYVREFINNSDFMRYKEDCSCLATSSTSLRLMSMVNNFGQYERDKSDGKTASIAEIDLQINKLLHQDLTQLAKNPYIGNNRAPIIIAACIIFKTIYDTLQLNNITASFKGAQEAIISGLINNE